LVEHLPKKAEEGPFETEMGILYQNLGNMILLDGLDRAVSGQMRTHDHYGQGVVSSLNLAVPSEDSWNDGSTLVG
jgi:hypothetical protein